MKQLLYFISFIILVSFGTVGIRKNSAKKRHFIVGYTAELTKQPGFYAGTTHIRGEAMPNINDIQISIERKGDMRKVTVISISEFSEADCTLFFSDNIKPSPSPLPDSLPKYRYIMKAEIPSGQYFASLDTIHSIIPIIGKTLIVDDAEYWRSLLINQIIRLTQYARPDSVKIEGGGK